MQLPDYKIIFSDREGRVVPYSTKLATLVAFTEPDEDMMGVSGRTERYGSLNDGRVEEVMLILV